MKWYVQQDGTFEVLLMTLEAKIGSWFSEFDADATAQYTVAKFVVMCVRFIMGSRFPDADHAECTEHGAAFKNKLMQEYEKEDHVLTSMYWGGQWHALALVYGDDDGASEASPACAAFKGLLDVMTYVEHEDYQNVTDELVEMYGTIQLYYSATDAEFEKNYRNWSLKSEEDTQDGEGVFELQFWRSLRDLQVTGEPWIMATAAELRQQEWYPTRINCSNCRLPPEAYLYYLEYLQYLEYLSRHRHP